MEYSENIKVAWQGLTDHKFRSFLTMLGIIIGIGAVIAILGDLCASIIKRQLGIKDYGKIMPGHGGIMDRFDSWIFVAPVLYIWNLCFPFIG